MEEILHKLQIHFLLFNYPYCAYQAILTDLIAWYYFVMLATAQFYIRIDQL